MNEETIIFWIAAYGFMLTSYVRLAMSTRRDKYIDRLTRLEMRLSELRSRDSDLSKDPLFRELHSLLSSNAAGFRILRDVKLLRQFSFLYAVRSDTLVERIPVLTDKVAHSRCDLRLLTKQYYETLDRIFRVSTFWFWAYMKLKGGNLGRKSVAKDWSRDWSGALRLCLVCQTGVRKLT